MYEVLDSKTEKGRTKQESYSMASSAGSRLPCPHTHAASPGIKMPDSLETELSFRSYSLLTDRLQLNLHSSEQEGSWSHPRAAQESSEQGK